MKMDTRQIRAAVSRQIETATGSINGDIAEHRADLLERYMGEPYGDEIEGRSSVVMSDVADTIEWLMPELMDFFTAGDEVVEFTPQGAEDEQPAKQETSIVNHIFFQKNEGFLTLYQWFKDALIQKNGIVKSFWDEREVVEIEEYDELTPDELQAILFQLSRDGAEVTILEQSWELEEEPAGPLRVKIEIRKHLDEYKIVNVPPEEFLVSPQWNSIFLDGCPFVAHKVRKTVSDLIAMGFDAEQVRDLPDDDGMGEQERVERFSSPDNTESVDVEPDPSMREVTVHECYMRADRDGDGVAELLQVWVGGAGNEVLRYEDGGEAIDEVGHSPFDALTPIIMSHKFFGRSVAELVEDLQRIRTVLARQMLDNVYIGNNQRPHVDETMATENTIPDLLNTQIGYPVRGKGPMAGVQYPGVPNVTAEVLQAIEYVDTLRENRTGVTKYNQGLDADSLNKTATGIAKIMTASQRKVLLIARIFAETGIKALMRRIHRDLRKGPLKRLAARIRNQWVEVDPRTWRERADMTVSVGLGTGDKDAILQRLMIILQLQREAMDIGLAGPEQLLHTAHKLVETAGFKSPELFFTQQQQGQQQGDPAAALVQAEMQKAQMKAQTDMARDRMKATLDAARLRQDERKMLLEDDRKRDETVTKIWAEMQKAAMQGQTQISIEHLRGMMAPPGNAA